MKASGSLCAILFVLTGCNRGQTPDEILPAIRKIDWNPGVPGTFPYKSYSVNVKDFGAAGDGTADDTAALRKAIDDVVGQGGGIVNLPAGTYRITDRILVQDDYVILRGEEPAETHIKCDLQIVAETPLYSRICLEFGKSGSGPYVLIASGAVRGSNVVTLRKDTTTYQYNYRYEPAGETATSNYSTAISGFTPGKFVVVTQDNDEPTLYTVYNGHDWKAIEGWEPSDIVGQYAVITAMDSAAGTVTLDTPLYLSYNFDNPHCNPRIRTQEMVQYSGVEDLQIYQTAETSSITKRHNIELYNAAYGRVKNVESAWTNEVHVELSNCYRCEVLDSYMHDSFNYDGGHAYGVDFYHRTTDSLTQNNIYRDLNNAIHFHVGASGNVAGYEYQAKNVSHGVVDPNGIVSFHGHYANYNLVESCEGPIIAFGDWWGPNPYNTAFRNMLHGHSIYSLGENGNVGLTVQDHSHYVSLIGNELVDDSIIYVDDTVENILRHGNDIGGTVEWDSTISQHTLPASYYLRSKPAFFGTEPFPLFGPEVDQGSTRKLPAQERFETVFGG